MEQVQRPHLLDRVTLGHHLESLCLSLCLPILRHSAGLIRRLSGSSGIGWTLAERVLEATALLAHPAGLAGDQRLNDVLEIMLRNKYNT